MKTITKTYTTEKIAANMFESLAKLFNEEFQPIYFWDPELNNGQGGERLHLMIRAYL